MHSAERELSGAKRLVKHEMEGIGKQLKVDIGVSKNWPAGYP